jgi:hypothetical protein
MSIAIGDRVRLTNSALGSPAHDVVGIAQSGQVRAACGKTFQSWRGTNATARDERCRGCVRAAALVLQVAG